ncbi:MAG TPA: ferritin-like domain-containing protein [Gammaproteobacteria bacterium]
MAEEGGYLHEAQSSLTPATLDNHRAYRSLMEEIEAIDWYAQRIDATDDAELKAVLTHNRDEEKEHAAMVLEWLRRRDPVLDRHLRTYLFTSVPITEIEERVEAANGDEDAATRLRTGASDGSLRIGSLRGR